MVLHQAHGGRMVCPEVCCGVGVRRGALHTCTAGPTPTAGARHRSTRSPLREAPPRDSQAYTLATACRGACTPRMPESTPSTAAAVHEGKARGTEGRWSASE